MKSYHYEVPNELQYTKEIPIFENNVEVGKLQRVYSNPIKRFFDSTLDNKYFVRMECQIAGYGDAYCRKIQNKGRVYYNAIEENKPMYRIAYIGWKTLVPDLAISNGVTEMTLTLEHDDWSNFTYKDEIVARWKADFHEKEQKFTIELQIEDNCPYENPALMMSIAHATLFIGA